MDFRILGPLEVPAAAGPLPLEGTKQCALLAFLVLEANRVVSSERLIEAVRGGR
jgi:DNA-binding SARP family transcriptional activator